MVSVLSVSFFMAVISPRSCFSMYSSSRSIDASTLSSMLASHLPPSFFDTYSLSTSSLECNALCMVISFLFLWSSCLSHLVHFRKGPEYQTRDTAQAFIPLIRFLLDSLSRVISSSSDIFFLDFLFHLHLFDSVSLQDGQVFVGFLFSERSNLVLIL